MRPAGMAGAGTSEPLLPQGGVPRVWRNFCNRPCVMKFVGAPVAGILVLIAIVQGLCYWYACMKCGPHHLTGYEFPGGGPYDLIESETIMTVKQFGRSWIAEVWPARNGMKTGAATLGTIYRTWGPLWWTYTYEDNNGLYTWVVRDRPIALGGSHKMMRCDGKGNPFVYSEGGHWVMNRIKGLLGLQISSEYNIWDGGSKVATTVRVGGISHDANSQLLFKAIGEVNSFASGALLDTNHHGHRVWLVDVPKKDHHDAPVPNWIPNAIVSSFAIHLGEKYAAKAGQDDTEPQNFLVKGGRNVTVQLLPPQAAQPAEGPDAESAAEPSEEQGVELMSALAADEQEVPDELQGEGHSDASEAQADVDEDQDEGEAEESADAAEAAAAIEALAAECKGVNENCYVDAECCSARCSRTHRCRPVR